MKPAWDKLMKQYEGSDSVLVADVDCTAEGKSKCNEVGVRGYPSIKYGDPSDLQDYKGARDSAGLEKFATELKPACSPKNIHLCDDEMKAKIEEFTNLGSDERAKMISAKEEEMQKIESDYKTFVDGLQKSYKEASDKKDKDVEEIKSSGLGLLKAVHSFAGKAKSEL